MSSLGQHFSQIKLKKRQKNKPYKAFNRYRTDLSLVGLYILLYMLFILDRLQRGVFHHFLKFLYCHSSIFRCFFNRHTAFSYLFNQHPHLTNVDAFFSTFGLYALTKVAHCLLYTSCRRRPVRSRR